jgi:hypothetical protein
MFILYRTEIADFCTGIYEGFQGFLVDETEGLILCNGDDRFFS